MSLTPKTSHEAYIIKNITLSTRTPRELADLFATVSEHYLYPESFYIMLSWYAYTNKRLEFTPRMTYMFPSAITSGLQENLIDIVFRKTLTLKSTCGHHGRSEN